MNIDLSGIETDVLQALGIVLATAATYAIQQFVAKMKISKNSEIVATLDEAAAKAINGAIVKADQTIRDRGWDSIQVKDQVIASAANQLIAHGQVALANAGYDPNTQQGKKDIQDVVERAFPAAALEASNSPVTPPTENNTKGTLP
jgi:flavin-binding protein dodecin